MSNKKLNDATPKEWNDAWKYGSKRDTPVEVETRSHDLQPTQSDGSSASYYELPSDANELQDLISFKSMNAQIGEIFRASYRYGEVAHSKKLRDAKKIKFYAEAEIKRLEAGGQ